MKKTHLLIVCFCLVSFGLIGQPSSNDYRLNIPDNSKSKGEIIPMAPPPPDPIPIDGGVGFLLAAGIGYGLKRMKTKQT